ncbi:MAG: hypothetical protein RLY64_239 [Bacteroidota bacterium]|jgi:membrane associated rhomboid family serine protease
MMQLTPAVKNILIICVLLFFAKFGLEQQGIDLNRILGMHYPFSSLFRPHQLVSYMFMHADLGHIFSNMIGFVFFGRMLEQVWGTKRFIYFFLLTGLGALVFHYGYIGYQVVQLKDGLLALGLKSDDLDALLSLNRIDDLELINKNLSNIMPSIAPENQDLLIPALSQLYGYLEEPTIGASGALFGIIGAFAMLFPNTEIFLLFPPIPIKAKWLAIGYGAYEIYQAMQNSASDPIAHLAHLGGMAVGLALVYFVYNKQNRHFY